MDIPPARCGSGARRTDKQRICRLFETCSRSWLKRRQCRWATSGAMSANVGPISIETQANIERTLATSMHGELCGEFLAEPLVLSGRVRAKRRGE